MAVAALGCDVDDPAVLLASAELALDRARRFGDVNLETKALADAGLAHVQAGRMAEGMALLDEAMALAYGPADDVDVTGKSVCSFFTACYYAADFDRAGSWAQVLRRHGLIGKAPGVQVFLANHCDAVQATLLCELGRWGEAEALLTRAIEDFEDSMGMPSWHLAIALAELRIRQGRLADAELLLLGKEGHLQALLPAARLHLARGDHDLARATAVRGLRAVRDDRLRAAELLAVLVDVELGVGDLDAAAAACDDLVARADRLDVPGLQARTAAVRARVLAALRAPARCHRDDRGRGSTASRPPAFRCSGPPFSSTSCASSTRGATRRRRGWRPEDRQRHWPTSTWCCRRAMSSCSSDSVLLPRRRAPVELRIRPPSPWRTAAGW